MDRNDLTELHCISPIENVPSILERGILSHLRAEKVPHVSVANPSVQRERSAKRVPPRDRPLHAFANLYFDARNPMMYVLVQEEPERHTQLCVLRIRTHVLDLPGVMVTDRNAATTIARFYSPAEGILALDASLVFADWWTDRAALEQERRRQIRCAEVLVPDFVPPTFIEGAFVSCDASGHVISGLAPTLPAAVNPHLFFQ